MRRLALILTDADTELVELLGALAALGFGMTLLGPSVTFEGASYRAMRVIAPEEIWGASFALLALVSFVTMLSGRRRPRRWLAFALMLAFMAVGAMFFLANPGGVAALNYLVLALGQGIAFWRVRRDH